MFWKKLIFPIFFGIFQKIEKFKLYLREIFQTSKIEVFWNNGGKKCPKMAIFPVFSKKPLMMPSTFMPIFLGPKMGFSKCPLMMPSTFMPIFLGPKKGHFPPMGIGRNFQFLGFSLMMPSTFMPIFWPHFCRKLCFRWILSICRNWIFWIVIFSQNFWRSKRFFCQKLVSCFCF